MKLFYLVCLLLFSSRYIKSQNIYINYDIDTNVFDVARPLNLWIDFLETKDDSLGSQYWNPEEVKKYGDTSYFLVEYELNFMHPNYLELLSYSDLKILSIEKVQEYYKITTLMEFAPKGNKSQVQYIFHVYASEVNGDLKLFNALDVNSRLHLNKITIGYLNYYYPKNHLFNEELAQKQADFIEEISNEYEVPIDTIDYYFAPTYEDIQEIKGFDFVIGGSGESLPSGKADGKNRIVYSSGLGEYYPHEIIHILLDPHYPNKHYWFSEGIATYLGMSRGKELNWHLERLAKHLDKHPEMDLNNMLEMRSVDQFTDYRYVLGGWLMKKADEKGGTELMKKLLDSGRTKADFYAAIEDLLGIEREELNSVIREDLKNYK